jgi:hypothetical protein|tara:strand:+ start:1106 stop:1273 length:168 start_codon:yes stop_codon:yes gene_type:complete
MNDSWTVNGYTWNRLLGEWQLAEFASGASHDHAAKFFQRMYDTNKFGKLEMIKEM